MRTIRFSDNVLNTLIDLKGINEMFIEPEAVDEVRSLLFIGSMFSTEEELRGVRNGIVKDFSILKDKAFNDNQPERWFRLRDVSSAVVAVIDEELFKRGYEV